MIIKLQLMTMKSEEINGRFKWTKERVKELTDLYKKNHSIKAIADHFGTSVNSVSSKIKRLKIEEVL